MALTSIIGRELQKLSSNKNSMMERTILSSESSTFGDDDSDSDSHISGAKNLDAMFEKVMSSSSSVTTSASVDESVTQNRFRDNLYSSKLEEAKLAASAQLDLAFEILDIMKERNLSAGTVAYKCLIDACGRCGDTNRATKLLSKMHGDGIVADGVVYSCLVAAFSEESTRRKASGKSDLPGTYSVDY
jgi:pentatricopeptide repeat protein